MIRTFTALSATRVSYVVALVVTWYTDRPSLPLIQIAVRGRVRVGSAVYFAGGHPPGRFIGTHGVLRNPESRAP